MNQIRGDSQARSRECREWFGLPDAEDLLEEYSCALLKKILLQGRMYVFREHICFYSKVFTFVTKRTIRLGTVTSINRAKNMGFPKDVYPPLQQDLLEEGAGVLLEQILRIGQPEPLPALAAPGLRVPPDLVH